MVSVWKFRLVTFLLLVNMIITITNCQNIGIHSDHIHSFSERYYSLRSDLDASKQHFLELFDKLNDKIDKKKDRKNWF